MTREDLLARQCADLARLVYELNYTVDFEPALAVQNAITAIAAAGDQLANLGVDEYSFPRPQADLLSDKEP